MTHSSDEEFKVCVRRSKSQNRSDSELFYTFISHYFPFDEIKMSAWICPITVLRMEITTISLDMSPLGPDTTPPQENVHQDGEDGMMCVVAVTEQCL